LQFWELGDWYPDRTIIPYACEIWKAASRCIC